MSDFQHSHAILQCPPVLISANNLLVDLSTPLSLIGYFLHVWKLKHVAKHFAILFVDYRRNFKLSLKKLNLVSKALGKLRHFHPLPNLLEEFDETVREGGQEGGQEGGREGGREGERGKGEN